MPRLLSIVTLMFLLVLVVSEGSCAPDPTSVVGLGSPDPSFRFWAAPIGGTFSPRMPMTFIVIPLLRASPQTIGYALGADDEIWDEGAGRVSGNGGRSSTGTRGGSRSDRSSNDRW